MVSPEEFAKSMQGVLNESTPNPQVLVECLALCQQQALLPPQKVAQAFYVLMEGTAADEVVAAFLTALQPEVISAEQLAAGAAVLRHFAAPVPLSNDDRPLCDTCGTGGDRSGSFNISTAVALLVASAGIKVAKHGNRSITSACGSADVLEALGVKVDGTPEYVAECIHQIGIGFLFAPMYHSATRHVQPIRKALAQQGIRTMFNVLGPLVNPTAPEYQMIGVYDQQLVPKVAEALRLLGVRRALVVHGTAGDTGCLDEISPCGWNDCAFLSDGQVELLTVDPVELGIPKAQLVDLSGGSVSENASMLETILAGEAQGQRNDAVALSAGAALWVCQRAETLADGLLQARKLLAARVGYAKLDEWRRICATG